VGFALAIFWGLFLLGARTDNQTPNRILAALLFLISVGIANSLLRHTKYIFEFPHVIGVALPLSFIYPPLFFLYINSLVSRKLNLKRQIFHFIPFIVLIILLTPFFMQSGVDKTNYLISALNSPPVSFRVVPGIIILQEAIYISLSFFLLARHSRKVTQTYSTLNKWNLKWIRNLIIAYVLITLIFILLQFQNSSMQSIRIGPIAVCGFIYVLGYMGLRQPTAYDITEKSLSMQKYQKSGLTPEMASMYLKNLIQFMEIDKPFFDSNLTLYKLASSLSMKS